LEREKPEILQAIAEKKEVSPELDELVAAALKEFNARFHQEIG